MGFGFFDSMRIDSGRIVTGLDSLKRKKARLHVGERAFCHIDQGS